MAPARLRAFMRLPVALLLAALLAGCAAPATPGTTTATSTPSGATTATTTTTPTTTPTTQAQPPGTVWLIAETGNLTLDGPAAQPNGACTRVAPDGHVDTGSRTVQDADAQLPEAAAVLFVDPSLSRFYPGFCGGDQLFAVHAPGGNQTQRDGSVALAVRADGATLWLDGQAMRDGAALAKHVDLRWSDGAGQHHLYGDVRYAAAQGWLLAPAASRSGLDLYWGPALS